MSKMTRWIVALLLLTAGLQLLTFVSALQNAVVVFWGLSFACLICALVLALRRQRTEHGKGRG